MTKTRTARGLAAIAALCVLVLTFCVPAALAASYSKVYGKTTERIRVREKASTNATVIDNIVKDACVYVTDSETSGSNTFVQVKYRASDGTVATGWLCQSDGSSTYVKILTNDSAKSSYGVSGGNVPSKVVGTFTTAQRESAKKTASSSYIGSGSSGTTVRDVQTKLKALGIYSGEITGNVGSKTEAAIKAFQKRYGLTADGIAGPQTVAKIDAVYASSGKSAVTGTSGGNIKLGSSGTDVAQLQQDLKTLGYYAAEITGNVGAKTQTAIKEFQRKNGLSADGVAGSKTLAAIAAAVGRSSGSGTSSSGTTLRRDSSGTAVSALQQNLATLGIYGAEVTGHYGSKTEAAVRKFQSEHGLSADGIAGPKTLDAIATAVRRAGGTVAGGGSNLANVSSLREGSTGTAVTELQNMLAALGYYYGEVTGHYGSLTKKAVRAFQDAQGLTVDGVAGSATINRLRNLAGGSTTNYGASTGSTTYGRISRDKVNLRQQPNMNSSTKIVAELPLGTICRISKQVTTGDTVWLYVSATVGKYTYTGYVRRDMIDTVSTSYYEGDDSSWRDLLDSGYYFVRVTGSTVWLRDEPNGTRQYTVEKGDVFYVVDQDGIWLQLNNELWIDSDFVERINADQAGSLFNGAGFEGPFSKDDYSWQIRLVQQALRYLDFYPASYDISGNLGTATLGAINDFRKAHNLPQNQTLDQRTYEAIIDEYIKEGGGSSASTPGAGTVYNVDWFTYKSDLNTIGLRAGQGYNRNLVLTDLTTGYSMYIYVQSTGNHADCEPLTYEDTNTLCNIFGVKYPSQIDYKRRPMLLTITNGNNVYQFVCSIYAEVHGAQDITTNGYNGQFCLHFWNSRTHNANATGPDPDHKAAIEKAMQMLLEIRGITVQEFKGL